MSKKDINKVSPYGSTPLQAAVHSNDRDLVLDVISKKANPNITEKHTGETALHRAVLNKNIDILQILIGSNANLDACGLYGSALHLASIRDIEITKALITHKATINLPNDDGLLPIHVSALHEKYDTVKLLAEHNGEINSIILGKNKTLLHYAMEKEKYV